MKRKQARRAGAGDRRQDCTLEELGASRRALNACAALGVVTVADFVARDRAEFLAVRNCGPKTYAALEALVRGFVAPRRAEPPPGFDLLPAPMLQFPLAGLGLAAPLERALTMLQLDNLGDLLSATDLESAPGVGARGLTSIRDALDDLLRAGLDQGAVSTFEALVRRLLAVLEPPDQKLLRSRLGMDSPPRRISELAVARRCTPARVAARLNAVRKRLHDHARSILEPVREEARRLLQEHGGLVTPEQLEPGTALRGRADEEQDLALPMRLLAFCHPDDFFLLGQALTGTPPRVIAAIRREIRQWARGARMPVALAELERQLADRRLSAGFGLLRHLLRDRGLAVTRDPVHGDVISGHSDVVDRVQEILAEKPGPMPLDDLVFHYRDRYRSCHKGRLLEHLRADPRMLEVGPELWTLRERHRAELEDVADEARRVATRIYELGGRHNVADLVADSTSSERRTYLLLNCLREDPRLRDLGRGDFCSREQELSGVMRQICGDLRRAMGELPVSRFLENQDEARRRVIARLLRENRMFVEPSEDRVDLITNYPFNEERLAELRHLVDGYLDERSGYATLSDVMKFVRKTPLGGSYLGEHLLGDLLRRHGSFEILPGGFIARPSLGLGGWIQQKAREVLRDAELPLTPEEIVAEVPELAEFTAGLEILLERDPLVETSDSMHYRIV